MADILTHPTYDQIHHACINFIGPLVEVLDHKPEIIVGLTRGGLLPAAILSHCLGDIPMIPVSYSSKKGRGDDKSYNTPLPRIGTGHNLPTILIVDDICDSGYTLHEIYAHYRMHGNRVYTAALYYKEIEDGPIVPDIYWQKIPADSDWIVFPFEIKS